MIDTKEKFRHEVIQSILKIYPEWKIEKKDEFAISVEVSGKNGCINLDNLYRQVQLHYESKQNLIRHFLSEFAKVIITTENPLDSFDVIKNRISLVIRPTDLYKECLGSEYDKQLAFSLPVLPELALYWVIDNMNSWQYVVNAQFSKWNVNSGEVTQWAYINTCKAEEFLSIAEIGYIGLLISTKRKSGTISHLLYELRNLQGLIHSARPDWSEQPFWVCIPIPDLIIVVKEGHDEIVKDLSRIAYRDYGKALSNRIYVFSNSNFSGEVIHQPDQKKPIIMSLQGQMPELVLPD